MGQGRRRFRFSSALNLMSKDGKDPVAGYEGNEIMELRIRGNFAHVGMKTRG